MFTSPTDSDFLDGQDGLEAVRWVTVKHEISYTLRRTNRSLGPGTRSKLLLGFTASTVVNTNLCLKVYTQPSVTPSILGRIN